MRVLLSGVFSSPDYRELQALEPVEVPDRSGQADLWLDYVADLGDGWNSTYTVARLLATEGLKLDWDGETHATERGRILVMGATRCTRCERPRSTRTACSVRTERALPCAAGEAPELFAIPGSHDWYDGLVNFSSIFCRKRWIGGWRTHQRRSYFALKLPNRWWLWGVDIQFGSYIDEAQLRYFAGVALDQVKPGDRIILCARPRRSTAAGRAPRSIPTGNGFPRARDHPALRRPAGAVSQEWKGSACPRPRRPGRLMDWSGWGAACHPRKRRTTVPQPAGSRPPGRPWSGSSQWSAYYLLAFKPTMGSVMSLADALIGGNVGLLLDITIGSYFRPLAAWIERQARSDWADPVLVAVERDPEIIWTGTPDWVGFSMYVDDPQRFSGSDVPAGRDEWLAWARSLNTVDAITTPLKITIQTRTEAAVLIEAVRVIGHRQVPLKNGIILTRDTGGADLDPRCFEIDLDWGQQVVVTWTKCGGESGGPPAIKLSAGDVEQFHVWAKAKQRGEAMRHEWTFDLHLLVEGKKVVRRIANSGSPFVTVSPGDLPHKLNAAGNQNWLDWPV